MSMRWENSGGSTTGAVVVVVVVVVVVGAMVVRGDSNWTCGSVVVVVVVVGGAMVARGEVVGVATLIGLVIGGIVARTLATPVVPASTVLGVWIGLVVVVVVVVDLWTWAAGSISVTRSPSAVTMFVWPGSLSTAIPAAISLALIDGFVETVGAAPGVNWPPLSRLRAAGPFSVEDPWTMGAVSPSFDSLGCADSLESSTSGFVARGSGSSCATSTEEGSSDSVDSSKSVNSTLCRPPLCWLAFSSSTGFADQMKPSARRAGKAIAIKAMRIKPARSWSSSSLGSLRCSVMRHLPSAQLVLRGSRFITICPPACVP